MTVPQRISSEGLDDTICLTREGSREVEAKTVPAWSFFLLLICNVTAHTLALGYMCISFPSSVSNTTLSEFSNNNTNYTIHCIIHYISEL